MIIRDIIHTITGPVHSPIMQLWFYHGKAANAGSRVLRTDMTIITTDAI